MKLNLLKTDPSDYVVLDIETTGLRSREDDVLAISLFKPDDNQIYNRLLPLELKEYIPPEITALNGIHEIDIIDRMPLSQEEVNYLFDSFDLDHRTILHYGSLDKTFIRAYFERHNLDGFNRMRFFNFKNLICSSKYSDGSITKDNLCKMFNIEGVTQQHSSHNDCILEWNLFKAINGRYLLVTSSRFEHQVFSLSEDYIVPASYLATYPNLSRIFKRPHINCDAKVIKRFSVSGKGLKRFPTNISGVTIEHLINSMLRVNRANPWDFLISNKSKLEYLGSIEPLSEIIPVSLNNDGTVTAQNEKDKALEIELNQVNARLGSQIDPLRVIQNCFCRILVR